MRAEDFLSDVEAPPSADDFLGAPEKRRGGTRSEYAQASTAAREARGPVEPDPLLNPGGRQPLPDGVAPNGLQGGRGVVSESPGARQAYKAKDPQPFRDREEAIDEAVNLLDEGVDPQKVYDHFRTLGPDFQITRPEIEARGMARGSPFFAPQTTRPANNELMAGATGFDEAKPRDIGVVQDVANMVGRGAEQFKQTIDAAQFLGGGIDAPEMAERLRSSQRRTGAMAPAEATQAGLDRLQQADATGDWGAVLSAAAEPRNWRALGSLVTESAVATAPAIIANGIAQALTGGAGGMPVAAATTFAQEYTAALGEELSKRGIDASDPVKVAAALADRDVLQAIDERGRIRGAAVGAFGAITMGAAGAIGRTMARLQSAGRLTTGRAVAGASGGAAVGIGGDMAGEAVAQRGVGENKPLEVLVEGLAGAPGSLVEVGTAFLTARAKPGEAALPPTQARESSISRFGEMAAWFGLTPKALAMAREAAQQRPASEVPAFLARVAASFNDRKLFSKPIDEQGIAGLSAALDGKPPEPPGESGGDSSGVLWRGPNADIPVKLADGPVMDGPDGRKYQPVIGPDGKPSFVPADELVRKTGSKEDAAKDEAVSNIEATLKAAGALPDEAINAPGLVDGQNDTGLDETLPRKIAGEPISRDWTAFAPESGTLGIPRSQMPQIAAEHRGALVNFLNARGVAHEMAEVDPAELKPTQAEFQPKKVAGIAESPSTRSLLVSSDGHILDGHHQYLAALETGRPVRVVRLDAPIQDLLRLATLFPSSTTAKGPSKTAGAPNEQSQLSDPAPSVPRAGPDGAGAAGVSGGTVRPVADDAQRGNAADPAAAAASGRPGDDAGRGRGDDAALRPNESDQDRSNREWRENYEAVVSTDDLGTLPEGRIRQAINYAAKRFVNLQPAAWSGDQAAKDQMTALDRERDLMEFHLKTRKAPNAAAPVTTQPPAQAGATEAAAPGRDVIPAGLRVVIGDKAYPVASYKEASELAQKASKEAERRNGGNAQFKGRPPIINAQGDIVAHIGVGHKIVRGDPMPDGDPPRDKVLYDPVDEIRAQIAEKNKAQAANTIDNAPTPKLSAPMSAPRVIGKYGRTPNGATEIELRPNADGTLTPHTGKYPMVGFESGEPITLPADVTDAQAAKAIRDAGAVTAKDKFYGVKEDAAPAAAAPAPAPQATPEELLSAAEKRVDGLKALLACLTS